MTREEHLLTVASEECAEVAQRVSKALRFGLEEIQPGQRFTNAERIMHEYADLCAAMEMLEEEGLVATGGDFAAMVSDKKEKVGAFLEYSKRCGTL
jgi:hypothetical protein